MYIPFCKISACEQIHKFVNFIIIINFALEYGGYLHRPEYYISGIGGNLYYDVFAVEASDDCRYLFMLVILYCYHNLLNLLVVYYSVQLPNRAEVRHNRPKAFADSAVHRYEAHK